MGKLGGTFRTIVFVVIAVVGGRLLTEGGFAIFQPPMTEAEIAAVAEDSGIGAVYQAIDTYFPEDAAEWRDEMNSIINRGRRGLTRGNEALEVGARIRRRHAHLLATAPDRLLRRSIAYQGQLLATVADDPESCARMAIGGAATLSPAQREALFPLLDDGAIVFEAMHAGRETPVSHGPATEADWINLFAQLSRRGVTPEDLETLQDPEADPATICRTSKAFIDAVANANFVGAARIRAETAVLLYSI